jgi:formylglycine-generating enzyme required for sulfatase activity
VKEIDLRNYESKFTSLTFLRTIASSTFIALFVVLLPLFALDVPNGFITFFIPLEILGSTAKSAKVVLVVVSAMMLIPWLWALSRLWVRTIAVYSLVIGGLLVVTQLIIALTVLQESSFASSRHITVAAFRLSFTIAGAVVSCCFAWFIVRDGCLAASQDERRLLATAKPGFAGLGTILQSAFGVEPICSWLPHWWQRAATTLLFLLASTGQAISIFLLILLLMPFRVRGVTIPIPIGTDLSPEQLQELAGPFGDILARAVTIAFYRALLIVAVIMVRSAARRLARVSVKTLLEEDKRAPVLFLRSFHDDQIALRWGNRGRVRDWAAFGEASPSLDHLILHEIIPLGPIVAIGRPGMPVPFGIARTYVSDDSWQSEIAHLAEVASTILIVLDDTPGVKWELDYVENTHSDKTLYLLPPRLTSPDVAIELLNDNLFKRLPPHRNGKEIIADRELALSCIGWYLGKDREPLLLTCDKPTAVTYAVALRLYVAAQANAFNVMGHELTVEKRHETETLSIRDVDAFFETDRGMTVLLTDGRVAALVDGRYRVFVSANEYRELFVDESPWKAVDDAKTVEQFVRTHSALFVKATEEDALSTAGLRPAKSKRLPSPAQLVMIVVMIGIVGAFLLAPIVRTTQNSVTALSPDRERALGPGDMFQECTRCPEMIVVPAGNFTMGSPATERGRRDDEGPQHPVTFARQFAVAKFELRFDEWQAYIAERWLGNFPSDQGWGRGGRPVINVSWKDAKAYVAWLSKRTGKHYRLLSEAEYEYASRAGSTAAYPWGDDVKLTGQPMANCNGCGSKWNGQTAPVGSFPSNKFGLYDVAGNVWEWIEDCYHANYSGAPTDGSAWVTGDCARQVVRGGSYLDTPDRLRSANRGNDWSVTQAKGLGLRVARTLLAGTGVISVVPADRAVHDEDAPSAR